MHPRLAMQSNKESKDDSKRPAKKTRQRPGRFRRWLLRPVMWTIASIALLILALQLGLQTRWAGAYFAGLVEKSLADLLDREVWVGSVRLKLLPLGVEIQDFRLGGPEPDDPPFLTVKRAVIDAEIVDLQRRVLTIHEVILEEPHIFLDFIAPKQNNLPKVAKKEGSKGGLKSPMRVNIRHLALAGGELQLAHRRLPLDLTATALNAELSGGAQNEVTGRVVAGNVDLILPKAHPISLAVGMRVVMDPKGMRILNGRIGSPDLTATVSGRALWSEKEWVFEIEGQGNAALFERMGYLQDQIQGAFFVDGGFAWSESSWGFRAQVTSPYLRVLGREMNDVRTAVSGDRNGVLFDLERALHARGNLSGTINLDTGQTPRALEIDLNLDGVDLQQLFNDQDIPVEGLSGRVSGVFDYRFPFGGAREGRGWADLYITPVDKGGESIPIEGSIPLLIEEGVIRTQAARLTGPYQRIEVDGYFDIDHRRGQFGYRIESDRIERIPWLIPIDFPENSLWLPTEGTGVLEGVLDIGTGQVSTTLLIDLADAVAPGAVADRVQGNLAIGKTGLQDMRLELLRPSGGLIVTGSIPFQQAAPDAAAPVPFTISVDAAGWPMDQVRPWLPMEIPADGPIYGSVRLGGEMSELEGQIRAVLRPATVGEMELEELALRVDFDPTGTDVERLSATVPAGEIYLKGRLDTLDESIDFKLRSDALAMDRAPFVELMPGGLVGTLLVDGTVTGRIDQPHLIADLRWQDLILDEEVLGRDGWAEIRLEMAEDRLQVEGELLGLVDLEGGGRLDRTGFDLAFDLSSSVLDELILLTGRESAPEVTGAVAGKLLVAGELDRTRPWRASFELAKFDITYQGLRLQALEPIVATLQDDTLHIESFFVGEPEGDSEMFLNGSLRLEEPRRLDLRLQSSLETNWLELVLPDLGLRSGQFDLLATIRGSRERPEFNGQGQLYDGKAIVEGLPFTLDQIEGILLFDPDQIIVDEVTAVAAGGTLRASGTVRPFTSEDFIDYRIQVVAEDLNVPYPEDWATRGRADLVISSLEAGHQIAGSVDLDRALYVEDIKLGLTQLLSGIFTRRRLEVAKADDLSARTELNIAVRGPAALRVRNNLADLHGDLDLLLRGTLSRPIVFGEVKIEPEGTLVLGPNEYIVERGSLRFTNPLKIEPIVDLVARADVREYDITLNLSGTFENLNLRYTSNPPLADLEVLSLLTTGEETWATGSSIGRTEDRSAEQATDLLYGQAASLVTQRTGRLFGLDRFRVQPLTKASGELSSARVTLGKQLSRDVYITYSYDPTSTAEDVIEIEWKIQKGITLKLRQTGTEAYGADVLWRKTLK